MSGELSPAEGYWARTASVNRALRELALSATSVSSIDLPASTLVEHQGTPSRGNPNITWNYWLLTTSEAVGSSFRVPEGWATADIEVEWVNAGTGTGDVSLRPLRISRGEGGTLASAAGPVTTVAASAQNVVVYTTLQSGLAVTPGDRLSLAVDRFSTDDTLANDIGVLALHVSKAS